MAFKLHRKRSAISGIVGRYGKEAKETVKKLLTHNMIHFLGSDNHKPNTVYAEMPEILNKLEKLIGPNYLKTLSLDNPQKILNNENIEIDDPEEIKRSWKFWRG